MHNYVLVLRTYSGNQHQCYFVHFPVYNTSCTQNLVVNMHLWVHFCGIASSGSVLVCVERDLYAARAATFELWGAHWNPMSLLPFNSIRGWNGKHFCSSRNQLSYLMFGQSSMVGIYFNKFALSPDWGKNLPLALVIEILTML